MVRFAARPQSVWSAAVSAPPHSMNTIEGVLL